MATFEIYAWFKPPNRGWIDSIFIICSWRRVCPDAGVWQQRTRKALTLCESVCANSLLLFRRHTDTSSIANGARWKPMTGGPPVELQNLSLPPSPLHHKASFNSPFNHHFVAPFTWRWCVCEPLGGRVARGFSARTVPAENPRQNPRPHRATKAGENIQPSALQCVSN